MATNVISSTLITFIDSLINKSIGMSVGVTTSITDILISALYSNLSRDGKDSCKNLKASFHFTMSSLHLPLIVPTVAFTTLDELIRLEAPTS